MPRVPSLIRAAAAVAALAVPGALAAQTDRASADTLRLGLTEAVSRVLQLSDEARLARAQVEQTEAQVTTARAAGLPQLRLNSGYTQVLKNARAEIVGAVFNQNYVYTANANLQQPLFQGGRIVAAARAADRSRDAARLSEGETRAQLAVDVQRAYLNARFTARLAEIQATNIRVADERVAQVEQLVGAGRAARYDLLRARVERANLEPLRRGADRDRELALLDLKALLNVAPERPLVLVTELDTAVVDSLVVAMLADDAPARPRALERAAELTVGARRDAVAIARADLLPTFNAFFTYGFLALPNQNGFPTVLGQTANTFCPPGTPATRLCQNNGWFPDRQFGFNFSLPLFDGLRAKGQIDLAQANQKVAEAQLSQTRELVQQEVTRARAELDRARAVARGARVATTEAIEAFQLARLRFERNVGTQLELSDAQVQALFAASLEARATYDLYLAAVEYARARGRPIPLAGMLTSAARIR